MLQNARHSSVHASSTSFYVILGLFLSSRLMLLLAFPPENLITYGDFRYYFDLADMTRQGFYPFLDYWQEYPPIFPYLNIAVYFLAGQQFKNYIVLLAFMLLLFDCANLYLLYRLALALRGPVRAIQIAWIYTAVFVPIFFLLGSFDTLTTFFILLALYALTARKNKLLAMALGLGTMVKFLPAVLVATVWRARGFRAAVVFGAATLIISLLVLGPFYAANPAMVRASLLSQPSKSSYETVWALVDNNYTTGSFGPLADRLDPANATRPLNNPARIPGWLTFIPFGLVGFYIFTRPQVLADGNADAVIFTTLTLVIFFLWSPGWSPQWQTFLIPLLLLALTESRAILFIIVLGFINFLEWPLILSRGMSQWLPITVIARTFIFILLGVELYRNLIAPAGRRGEVQN